MVVQPPGEQIQKNISLLYRDIAWFGILGGSSIAFLSIYAARLGASAFDISLLTALPALVNLLFSLPAGQWLESYTVRGGTVPSAAFWSALLHRAGYLLLVPLPALAMPRAEIGALVGLTLLMSIPGTLLAISFNAMFADVVPLEYRGEVVGRRNAIMAVTLTAASLLSGVLLDRLLYPFNFQVVFAVGLVGAACSTYYLAQVRTTETGTPRRAGLPLGDLARPGLLRGGPWTLAAGLRFLARSRGRRLLRVDLLRTSYGPFLAAYLGFYVLQYLPTPLFPIAFVRLLNLTNTEISIGSALFYATMVIASLRIGNLVVHFGHKRLLVFGALAYSIYPLLLGLARDASLYLAASLVGGLVFGVLNAALINRLMEQTQEGNRAAYMALHNLVLNFGILTGVLLGPWLGEHIGIREALLLAGGLRLLISAGLAIWA